MRLATSPLQVEIDDAQGVITTLRIAADGADGPDYVGHHGGSADPLSPVPQALGDILVRTWTGHDWRAQRTAASSDIRRITRISDSIVSVVYEGPSNEPDGVDGLEIVETFRVLPDGSLCWETALTNVSSEQVEIGELSFPFVTNTGVREIFEGTRPTDDVDGSLQVEWHEHRLLQHLFISGHGSYALLQRPSGDLPALLVHPVGDTPLEVAYQMDPTQIGQWGLEFEGPYYLSIVSRAARTERRWLANRERQALWFNGHSSLLLDPGASRPFALRFVAIPSLDAVARELVEQGQVAVDVAPGMVTPVDHAVHLRIGSRTEPELQSEDDAISIDRFGKDADGWSYRLHFASPGQKRVLVRWGDHWSRLLFFATEPADRLLDARARTISRRQLYRNETDPYGRHHAFLPLDDRVASLFLESEETWQSGASDEYGLPIAMFLASKQAIRPEPFEIEVLERYVDEFLFRRLQDPGTLLIRRGMYWRERRPSSRSHEWDAEQAATTTRSFNYALTASIYHSLYRVGRLYGLTRRRPWRVYLSMAWRTATLGFDVSDQSRMGAPAGIGYFALLDDLERDDRDGYQQLYARLERFAAHAASLRYPFGSELYTDQTGQPQVYEALRRFGSAEQRDRAVRVIRALRSASQPAWFSYGNDKRGNVCLWYGTGYNSIALLTAYDGTGDSRLLALGHGGLASLLALIRADGVARGWFTWWPDRTGFDSRSLDSDMALHAYLEGARAYAIRHPVFGWVGYGCTVTAEDNVRLSIEPTDGVRKRLLVPELGLDVRLKTGEIAAADVSLDASDRRVLLDIDEPSGYASMLVGSISAAGGGIDVMLRGVRGTLATRHVTRTWSFDETDRMQLRSL